jgi:hypothetical protein
VPDVTSNKAFTASDLTQASRLGASSLRVAGFPGTAAPAAASGTGPCAVVVRAIPPIPPVQRHVVLAAAPADVVTAQLGQVNSHNYMTRAYATGEGASGPPPEPHERKPV